MKKETYTIKNKEIDVKIVIIDNTIFVVDRKYHGGDINMCPKIYYLKR